MNQFKYEIDYEYERDGISLEELREIPLEDLQDPVLISYKLASKAKPEANSFKELAAMAALFYDSMSTKK